MSPERAAETARIEIVALFMPTCLSSAVLVPRAQLFYILLPGAIELSPAVAGSKYGSPSAHKGYKYLFNGLRPGEKRAKARGEEPCCAR